RQRMRPPPVLPPPIGRTFPCLIVPLLRHAQGSDGAAMPLWGCSVFASGNVPETTSDRIADVAQVVRDVVHPGIRGENGYVGYVVLGASHTGKTTGDTLCATHARRA